MDEARVENLYLGHATAYGYAKAKGYEGTEEEFAQLCADLGIDIEQLENMTVIINMLEPDADPSGTYSDGVLTLNLPRGVKGDTGESAYEYAVAGGYTGTEEEFTQLCADLGIEVDYLENMTVVVNMVDPSVQPSASYVDGTLTINVQSATDAQVAAAADAWLQENITNPSNPPLDRSLTLANAAAPADLVGNLKSAITEYVPATEVTSTIDDTYIGVTIKANDEGGLTMYGNGNAARRFVFLNGQVGTRVTTSAFNKTLDAGTYLIETKTSGYGPNISVNYTYSTFANDRVLVIATSEENSFLFTFTDPVMIGFVITSSLNCGTSENPTYFNFSAKRLSATDFKARNEIEALKSRTNALESETISLNTDVDNLDDKIDTVNSNLSKAINNTEASKVVIKMATVKASDGNVQGEYDVYVGKNVSENGFIDATGNVFLFPDIGFRSVTLPGAYSVYSCDANGVIAGEWSRSTLTTYLYIFNKPSVEADYIAVYMTASTSFRHCGFSTLPNHGIICPRGKTRESGATSYVNTYTFVNGVLQNEILPPDFVGGVVLDNGASAQNASKSYACGILVRAGTRINTKDTALTCNIYGCTATESINISSTDFDAMNKDYIVKNDAVLTISYEVGTWSDAAGAPDITALQAQYFVRFINDTDNKWKGKTWYSYGTSISDVGINDTAGNNGHKGKWVLAVDAYSKMNRINGAWGSNGIMSDSNLWNAIMSTPFDVDLVTLELGPNDTYWSNMGEVGDTGDTTWMGRLYQIYDYLTKNTRAQVIFVAVGARQFTMDTTDIVPANGTWRERYRDLVSHVKALSERFGIPVIDADGNACNLNRRGYEVVMADYIHYTYLGGEMYGRYIWNQIKSNEPYPVFASNS